MDINRNNYEKYFLDFVEGNLSADEEKVVRSFLRFNPDLAGELDDFASVVLPESEVRYPFKEILKKETGKEDPGRLDDDLLRSIAYLEEDLTPEESVAFETELTENASLSAQLELLRKTYMVSHPIDYPDKEKLKRGRSIRLNPFRTIIPIAAAASIALLVLLRIDFTTPGQEIAAADEPVERSPEPNTGSPATEPVGQEVTSSPVDQPQEEQSQDPGNQTVIRSKPATVSPSLRVIRDTNAPVPASTLKVPAGTQATGKGTQDRQRIAGISLKKVDFQVAEVTPERLDLVQTGLPQINPASLSITQLARYQINRVNEIAEQDEQLLFSLASLGIKEINKRAGTNMSLLASTTEEGSINGIEFRSRILSVRTPLQREKN